MMNLLGLLARLGAGATGWDDGSVYRGRRRGDLAILPGR